MTTLFRSRTRCLALGLLTNGSCHNAHALHLAGKALRHLAVAAGAEGVGLEGVIERLAPLASLDHTFVVKELVKRQSLAAARIQESLNLARELVVKSNELTAKTEALHRAELMTAAALTRAGVVDDRTLLEYLAHFCQGTENACPEIWKRLFRKYPGLLDCLRKNVPTWVRPGMSKQAMEDNIAKEIEAIYTNAGGDLHTFDSKRGLVISKDEPDEPTAKALACLAKCSGTPYMVVSEVTVDDADEDPDNTPA